MPSIARVGDLCTGHGCFPPRAVITGSSNVFINGIPAVTEGDLWEDHTCGNDTHTGVQLAGSGTVLVNGKSLARTGDPISCGSVVAEGSPSVMAG